MITIHNELVRSKAVSTAFYNLVESQHRQNKLRAHIFFNIIGVFARGPAAELSDAEDAQLADEARLKLEVDIPELYDDFRNETLDALLSDRVGCNRAVERPLKHPNRKAFEPNIPVCKRGKNKTCRIEEVIRTYALPLLEAVVPEEAKATIGAGGLEPPAAARQLCRALELARKVAADPTIDLTANQCRGCGDALIIVESLDHVTHGLSTNAKDWKPLCDVAGIEFHHVTYE
jgi:hypothetical protein